MSKIKQQLLDDIEANDNMAFDPLPINDIHTEQHIIDYKLVSCKSTMELESSVKNFLALGWMLYGDMVIRQPTSITSLSRFIQPMVLKK